MSYFIRGSKDCPREVIATLENKGGENKMNLYGSNTGAYYYIDALTGDIRYTDSEKDMARLRQFGTELKPDFRGHMHCPICGKEMILTGNEDGDAVDDIGEDDRMAYIYSCNHCGADAIVYETAEVLKKDYPYYRED